MPWKQVRKREEGRMLLACRVRWWEGEISQLEQRRELKHGTAAWAGSMRARLAAATLVVFGLGVLTLQVIVYEGTAILTDNHSRRASARARGASAVTELSNGVQLRTLHQSGPASTTIDIVLLSEAYTAATPFFADASRATRHYFSSDEATFYGISPLLNVHALYLPSAVGRIGWGAPAGTTFGCYRAVNEPLRAIFQANFTLLHAQRACRHHLGCSGCDFLVLLVNEPLYGGLAADGVTMITNSLTSGAISARHELAHALADFGEEYDGGGARGARATRGVVPHGFRIQ